MRFFFLANEKKIFLTKLYNYYAYAYVNTLKMHFKNIEKIG